MQKALIVCSLSLKYPEAIEFLKKARKFYVITPVVTLFYILRNWKFKRLVDKIFHRMDEITSEYVGIRQTKERAKEAGISLKSFC